jgi:hypothetical protein
VGVRAPTVSPALKATLEYSTRLTTVFDSQNGAHVRTEVADVETALDWAEVAAMLGDFREAVSWLVHVEWLQGGLPPELAERRAVWSCAARLTAA